MAEKILVIDDDALNLKMAEYILKNDYEVLLTKSGTEGLEMLRKTEVNLVLLDLDMPQLNGLQVLEIIRQDKSLSGVKVAILTASGYKEDVTEAIRLGALDFIKKPFSVVAQPLNTYSAISVAAFAGVFP